MTLAGEDLRARIDAIYRDESRQVLATLIRVRAKAKIRSARIPYEIPSAADLPERLDSVLHVIYLVFNEGYMASSGASLTRPDLVEEAVRLGRLLVELLAEPEAIGLLALMLLHSARDAARSSLDGDLVLLEDQDRSLWNDRAGVADGAGFQPPGASRCPTSAPLTPARDDAPPGDVHRTLLPIRDRSWTRCSRI